MLSTMVAAPRAADVPSANPAPSAVNVTPANILLIEPDPDCADALAAILAGLADVEEVDVVASVGDAVRELQAAALPPAIVMVDDQPGSTEILGTIEVISRLAPASALVLLCVYPQCIDPRVRMRVDRCISKDSTHQELAQVVGGLLRRS